VVAKRERYWPGETPSRATKTRRPKLSWQPDTGCAKRMEADVSAVADPATGVAVYDTYGGSGWAVYGDTSASAPLIAGIYALTGTPGANDYPAKYPYSHTAGRRASSWTTPP
jgi:hypothetical protein